MTNIQPTWDLANSSPTTPVDTSMPFRFAWNRNGIPSNYNNLSFRRRPIGTSVWYYVQPGWSNTSQGWRFNNGWEVETSPNYLVYNGLTEILVDELNYIPNDVFNYEYQISLGLYQVGHSPFSPSLILYRNIPIPEVVTPALNTGYIFFEGSSSGDNEVDYIGWTTQADNDEIFALATADHPSQLPNLGFINDVGIGYFYWLDKITPGANQPYNRIRRAPIIEPLEHQTVATLQDGISEFLAIDIGTPGQIAVVLEKYTGASGSADDELRVYSYDLPAFTNRQLRASLNITGTSGPYDISLQDEIIQSEVEIGVISFTSSSNQHHIYSYFNDTMIPLVSNLSNPAEGIRLVKYLLTSEVELFWREDTGTRTRIRKKRIDITNDPITNIIDIGPSHSLNNGAPNANFKHKILVTSSGFGYIYISRDTGPNIYRYNISGGSQRVYETDNVNVQDMQLYSPPGWVDIVGQIEELGLDDVTITYTLGFNDLTVMYLHDNSLYYQKENNIDNAILLITNATYSTFSSTYDDNYYYSISQTTRTLIRRYDFNAMLSPVTVLNNSFGIFYDIDRGKGTYVDRMFCLEYSFDQFRLVHFRNDNFTDRTVMAIRNRTSHSTTNFLTVTENYAYILNQRDTLQNPDILRVNLSNPASVMERWIVFNATLYSIDSIGDEIFWIETSIDDNHWYLKKLHEGEDHNHPIVIRESHAGDSDWAQWRYMRHVSVTPWFIYLSSRNLEEATRYLWKINHHGDEATQINPDDERTIYGAVAMYPSDYTHSDGMPTAVPKPVWVTTEQTIPIDRAFGLQWQFVADELNASQTAYKLIRWREGTNDYQYWNGADWRTGEPTPVNTNSTEVNFGTFWDAPNRTRLYRVATLSSSGKWSYYSDTLRITSDARESSVNEYIDGLTNYTVVVTPDHDEKRIHIFVHLHYVAPGYNPRTITIQRRIDPTSDAKDKGVTKDEIDEVLTVTENHPIINTISHWYDYRCRPGIDYEYRAKVISTRVVTEHGQEVVRQHETGYSAWSI